MSSVDVKDESKKCCKKNSQGPVTVDQLPVYGNPYPPKDVIQSDEQGMLESAISKARTSVQQNLQFLDGFLTRSKQIFETAKAHSMTTYEYISDDSNSIPKAVAITSGGLFGLLLASRRGFIRKILYTTTGLGVSAGFCFPKQSMEVVEVAGYIIKNKAPPMIKEYAGIDLNDYINIKSVQDSQETKTRQQEISEQVGTNLQ